MNSMEKKDKAVEPKKKTEKLFNVNVNRRVCTKNGALEVKDNPHKVSLILKKHLKDLGYIE